MRFNYHKTDIKGVFIDHLFTQVTTIGLGLTDLCPIKAKIIILKTKLMESMIAVIGDSSLRYFNLFIIYNILGNFSERLG